MKRILGESCYGLQRYPEAIKALEEYKRETADAPARAAMYKLGMSYFYTQVYSQAASALGETVTVQDALTQNAYLHMGLSYLQLKEETVPVWLLNRLLPWTTTAA